MDDTWIRSETLGRSKEFFWKIDKDHNLYIRRKFRNEEEYREVIMHESNIDRIFDYLKSNEWIALANNVQKLRAGTEKEGLGKFLYNRLGWNEENSQLSSHIGTILVNSNIWLGNGNKRGIEFKLNLYEWRKNLMEYYCCRVNENI